MTRFLSLLKQLFVVKAEIAAHSKGMLAMTRKKRNDDREETNEEIAAVA
ncbi:MAG: hypothetical protein U9Q18_06220 [Caldisericota bacterium]|nr:hypothetical protein [Caldisericota bacterium]